MAVEIMLGANEWVGETASGDDDFDPGQQEYGSRLCWYRRAATSAGTRSAMTLSERCDELETSCIEIVFLVEQGLVATLETREKRWCRLVDGVVVCAVRR